MYKLQILPLLPPLIIYVIKEEYAKSYLKDKLSDTMNINIKNELIIFDLK